MDITSRRVVRSIYTVIVLLVFQLTSTRGDPIYSMRNLGQVGPNSNYLDALSPADQGAFRSSSFDTLAHPATITPFHWSSDANYYSAGMVTSNNLGLNVGSEVDRLSVRGTYTRVAITQATWAANLNDPTAVVYTDSDAKYQQFYGSVAGINDQKMLALNENQYLTNNSQVPNPTPFLQNLTQLVGLHSVKLGSLGGTDGMAHALNNANQVVGWSQLANGVQHAFLYSNGTMQDLNLAIPPISSIVLSDAVGIDGSGRITAFGTDPSGKMYEFLLTPNAIPEPSTLALTCLAFGALLSRNWLRRRFINRD